MITHLENSAFIYIHLSLATCNTPCYLTIYNIQLLLLSKLGQLTVSTNTDQKNLILGLDFSTFL